MAKSNTTNSGGKKTAPTSKTKNKKKVITIFIRKNAPFSLEENEIIYLGGPKDTLVNSFIQENFSQLEKLFSNNDYKFTYLPSLANPELIRYNYPFFSEEQIQAIKIDVTSIESFITSYISTKFTYPCLIRKAISYSSRIYYKLYCYPLTPDSLQKQFEYYLDKLKYPFDLYSSINIDPNHYRYLPQPDKDKADKDFEAEAQQLIYEVKEKVSRLRQMGVSEYIFKQILLDQQPTLSRLVITSDYKILLPDYNNTEIRLHPLPKTVYFFFLKHHEGVLFKHLADYRWELYSIYKRLTNKDSLDDLYRSIEALTDSTTNSINEKCSRIKEAFYAAFTPSLADHYLITGKSSTPKSIKLDRDLVIWEANL